MATMAFVQTQVEETVKTEVEEVLRREGMTLAQAFTFFLERTAQEKAIPSEVFRPNVETVSAMEAARRGEVTSVESFQQLIEEIEAEDD